MYDCITFLQFTTLHLLDPFAYSGDVCFSFFGWLYEMAVHQELAEVTTRLPNQCTKCIGCYTEVLVFQGCP